MPKQQAVGVTKDTTKAGSSGHNSKAASFTNDHLGLETISSLLSERTGIVTVGLNRIILAATNSDGVDGFRRILGRLKKIEAESQADNPRRTLACVLDVESSPSYSDIEILRKCYLELGEDKAWLCKRSIVAIANRSEKRSAMNVFEDQHCALVDRSVPHTAASFFNSVADEPWQCFEGITAFVSIIDKEKLIYHCHRLVEGRKKVNSLNNVSAPNERYKIIRNLFRLARSSGDINLTVILEDAGFEVFSFEDFIKQCL